MKKIIVILFLLTFCSSFSQNYFFVDKKGVKTIINDDSFDLVIRDKRLQYVPYGKKWEKYIKYKDLDYAIIGSYYFKNFQLIGINGKKKSKSAYFVMAEHNDKKLLCFTYTIISEYSSNNVYDIYVIDANNQILDYVELNESKFYKGARSKISPFIHKHFSDCKNVMNEFSKYDKLNDDKNLRMLGFFKSPYYIKCDEPN